MLDMDKWPGTLQTADQSIASARQAVQTLYDWVQRNVVPDDIWPRPPLPPELNEAFQVLGESLKRASSSVREIDGAITGALENTFSGRPLSRGQFYWISAQVGLPFTNKTAGLSEYDDYEVFQNFCYEDGEQHAYIGPDLMPASPPVTRGETTTSQFHFGPSRPPEELDWDCLRPEQQRFFDHHLPDVACRFKRKN